MVEANKVVLSVIFVGIALVLGVYILSTMSATFKVATTATAANEQGSVTSTGYTLGQAALDTFSPTITNVTTRLDGVEIPSANYTLVGFKLYNATATNYAAVNVTYRYSYQKSTSTSDSADTATTALNSGLSWLTIIVVVGFAVIVLVLLNKGLGNSATGYESGGEVYEMQSY